MAKSSGSRAKQGKASKHSKAADKPALRKTIASGAAKKPSTAKATPVKSKPVQIARADSAAPARPAPVPRPKVAAVDPRPKAVHPPELATPFSRSSIGTVHGLAGGRRLIVSGQIGMRPDGTMVDGLEGQWEQAFANLAAVLRAADMTPANVVKIVAFCRVPRTISVFRAARDRFFPADPPPASTYLEVTGLAGPGCLCEIEAEAVSFD